MSISGSNYHLSNDNNILSTQTERSDLPTVDAASHCWMQSSSCQKQRENGVKNVTRRDRRCVNEQDGRGRHRCDPLCELWQTRSPHDGPRPSKSTGQHGNFFNSRERLGPSRQYSIETYSDIGHACVFKSTGDIRERHATLTLLKIGM